MDATRPTTDCLPSQAGHQREGNQTHASLWGRWAARISNAATLSVITAQDQGTLAPVTGSDTPAFGVEAMMVASGGGLVGAVPVVGGAEVVVTSVGAHD